MLFTLLSVLKSSWQLTAEALLGVGGSLLELLCVQMSRGDQGPDERRRGA